MPFHVIELESGQPWLDTLGNPIKYETGQEAASVARARSESTGKKHQPRPVTSDEWRQREQARFDAGHYQRLPWHDSDWFKDSTPAKDHYAHISTERDGMVAFTESAEKGAADRQTRMRPGAYLQRYFPELGGDKIQQLARDYAGKFEDNVLLFADTADEIERVYVEGPRSCMSSRASDYDSPFHPVRVYAAGDLAVAYVMRGGHIVGRALSWPAQKKFSRVYGDEDRLVPLLHAAGFRSGSLRGARLTRHEYDGGLVCPYIDCDYSVDDRGDFLHICGDTAAESTNGMIEYETGEYCESCDSRGHSEYDMVFIQDSEVHWCESCADNHAYHCAATGDYFGRERNVILMANGDYWSRAHFEHNGFVCDATGEAYPYDDSVHLESRNETWCSDHFQDNGFQCRQCSECFANEDGVETQDGMYCEDCAPAPEESDDSDSPAPIGPRHIARQGRDESPSQLEMTLDNAPFRAGDIVRPLPASTNPNTQTMWAYRTLPCNRHYYPAWTENTRLTISHIYENGNLRFEHQSGSPIGHGETWQPDCFALVQRNRESV